MCVCLALRLSIPLRGLRQHARGWLVYSLLFLAAMAASSTPGEAVESKQDSMRVLFQEKHEAWLEYCRRPEVWSRSRGNFFVNNEPFREIIRLGIPALPYLMEKVETAPLEGRLLHYALTAITKKKFHVRRQEIDGQLLWTVEEFPDIEPGRSHPDTNILWLRWWREEIKETPQQFEELYQEWKAQNEPDEAEGAYRKLVDLGVVALPTMVEKVTDGDAAMIPAIAELTDGSLAPDVNAAECLVWWEEQADKWIIRFPENGTARGPEDPAEATDHEEIP